MSDTIYFLDPFSIDLFFLCKMARKMRKLASDRNLRKRVCGSNSNQVVHIRKVLNARWATIGCSLGFIGRFRFVSERCDIVIEIHSTVPTVDLRFPFQISSLKASSHQSLLEYPHLSYQRLLTHRRPTYTGWIGCLDPSEPHWSYAARAVLR